MERIARAGAAMARRCAAGSIGPGLLEMGLGLGCGELKGIRVAPAWIDAAGALAAFREGCCNALGRDDRGADSTRSGTSRWRPVVASIISAGYLAEDGAVGDGPVELLQLLIRWKPSLSFVMQVLYLHMQKGMIDPTLYFFTQTEAAPYCLRWCGCEFEVHGMNKLLEANMLCHLRHLHQQYEDAPILILVSIHGYANFALHHICLEIIVCGHWSIVDAAQSWDYLNWDQFSSVNLWSQVSIIVTILQYNYVHTQESQTNGSPIDQIEQAYLTCYGCTRLTLMDVTHVEDTVPLLFGLCHRRWTTTPPLLILRFNSGDPSSLSSVKAIQYLQLNAHKPQVHMLDRPLGDSTAGH